MTPERLEAIKRICAHQRMPGRPSIARELVLALEAERARLDWLEEVGIETTRTLKGNGLFSWRDGSNGWKWTTSFVGEQPNLRAAIDAAREREKGATR